MRRLLNAFREFWRVLTTGNTRQAPMPHISPQSVAQVLREHRLGKTWLPSLQRYVLWNTPRSRELALAGMLPIKFAQMSKEQWEALSEAEQEERIKKAEKEATRVVCECVYEPRFVDRPVDKMQPGMVTVRSLTQDEVHEIYMAIMDKVGNNLEMQSAATQGKEQDASLMRVGQIAMAWKVSPLELMDLEPADFMLLDKITLLTFPERPDNGN